MRLFFALLLFPFFAHASTWTKDTGWELKPSSDGIWQVLPDQPSANKPSGVTCSSGNCTASRATPLPRVTPPTNFNPSSAFNKAGIALALASRAGLWITVGKAAYDWLKDASVTPQPDGYTQAADGTHSQTGYWRAVSVVNSSLRFDSPSAVCDAIQAQTYTNMMNTGAYKTVTISNTAVITAVDAANCNLSISYVRTDLQSGTTSPTYGASRPDSVTVGCYSNASGAFVVSPTGGLCPAGTQSPITSTQAAAALAKTSITDGNLARVWREVLDNGGKIDDTGPAQLTGPTQVSGPTSTSVKTTATGTQAVTTTTTNFNVSYNTNNITINESKVISNPDGSSETVTEKPAEPCAADPTSLACVKLGDPGTDSPQWQTKTVTYQAESLGLAAACPAPWTGTVHGWSLSMSWQPACDVAPNVRLGILALATLGALLMIVTTVRT